MFGVVVGVSVVGVVVFGGTVVGGTVVAAVTGVEVAETTVDAEVAMLGLFSPFGELPMARATTTTATIATIGMTNAGLVIFRFESGAATLSPEGGDSASGCDRDASEASIGAGDNTSSD